MTSYFIHKCVSFICIWYVQVGAQNLTKMVSLVGKEREVAAQAATEATMFASKAKDILNEMLESFNIETTNVRKLSVQLQVSEIDPSTL